ncbi:hypothetical protein Pfo_003962 [Paulownia fortunei]|nr:hypothetical protein Pfo_003962 [Paulownia fortunei]
MEKVMMRQQRKTQLRRLSGVQNSSWARQKVDMLENVEIVEQKQRDEAYKAARKKTGVYDRKFLLMLILITTYEVQQTNAPFSICYIRFNDEPGVQKKILPRCDDPVADEGVTLDSSGRFTGEAEKRLEEASKKNSGGFCKQSW